MQFTICGSFGFGNAGDEAVPLAVADMISTSDIDAEINILGRYPHPAMKEVIGTDKVIFKEEHEVIKSQPIILSGGGIIEQNNRATLFRCHDFIKGKTKNNVGLISIAVEPEVKYSLVNKIFIKHILKNLDIIYTRDVLSELTLNKISPKTKVETIGDIVLWLAPKYEKTQELIYATENKIITVCLCDTWLSDIEMLKWLSQELLVISNQMDANIIFIPMSMNFSKDSEMHQALYNDLCARGFDENRLYLVNQAMDPRSIAGIFKASELVISQRLHGCVMAYAQKTPFVGLGYHPKLYGFADTVGWKGTIVPSTRPLTQSKELYGYKYSDLNIRQGDCVNAAQAAITSNSFEELSTLKDKIKDVYINFLRQVSLGK